MDSKNDTDLSIFKKGMTLDEYLAEMNTTRH